MLFLGSSKELNQSKNDQSREHREASYPSSTWPGHLPSLRQKVVQPQSPYVKAEEQLLFQGCEAHERCHVNYFCFSSCMDINLLDNFIYCLFVFLSCLCMLNDKLK
ncbi:hypothetical protein CHARACLAT_031228 [Characodon lateralis]|uniref:Uncharacterized protein n=1 Tax=Characodon lateralis TaxID=208331 RepID=A0ABU7F7J8_9TELE|nr:hypothetical protein [Characodon lateralis]